ncbi:hypothetical protein N7472_002524 [Penicillium cf. griseofulvum]|uniref:Uncharacterized protein n=1 Tax=Penicillium cf. griseofulvum TaxID=2972120 RepID=A0A9W9T1R8_9EURO|nr:hypothetical protein N7472_002524 [Penicillium cf. griseofulvum]
MLTSGLTNAPLTKSLLIYTIASSIALSPLRHKIPRRDLCITAFLALCPVLACIGVACRRLHQFHRGPFRRDASIPSAGCRTRVGEAEDGAVYMTWNRIADTMILLQTFLLTTLPYTTLLPPVLLAFLIRPLSMNNLNYLPSGPTATIFALLAQYHATIPYTYRYRIGSTSSPTTSNTDNNTSNGPPSADNTASATQPKPPTPSLSLLLSDKSTTYLVAAQLALSQFPAMLLPSALGWIVGVAWRRELLPGLSPASTGFRVPAWVVGEQERRGGSGSGSGSGGAEGERYEDLRRRLEGEVAASASGLEGSDGQAQRRANGAGEGGGLVDRLRGAW